MPLEGLCSQTEAYWFYFGYSRVYERLQPYFTSSEMREAGLDLAAISGSTCTQRVLDVGAGTGTLSLQVSARVGAANVTLLDQSPQMLDQARAKPALSGARFVESDAHMLPLGDGSFDYAVSSGVIYYFPQPVVALREQLRVVRPGGRVLAMGSLQPKPRLVRFFAQVFNRFPTEEQYRSWFEEAASSLTLILRHRSCTRPIVPRPAPVWGPETTLLPRATPPGSGRHQDTAYIQPMELGVLCFSHRRHRARRQGPAAAKRAGRSHLAQHLAPSRIPACRSAEVRISDGRIRHRRPAAGAHGSARHEESQYAESLILHIKYLLILLYSS